MVLLLVCLVLGCGARTEVAGDKVLSKIDSLLGSLDVTRKEVEISTKALKDGIKGLRKAKIKAQVKLDQLQRKITPINEQIASVDVALQKMRGHLESKKPVKIGEKTYNPEELKEMANKIIQARKALVSQKDSFKSPEASLKKAVATLERKQQEYQKKLTNLESQIVAIDSKVIALKAMKDASATMGDSESSLADNVEDLENKVNDLYAEVETEMLEEDEKWNEAAAESEINSVDKFIDAAQEPSDVLGEIDAILGKSK